MFAFLNLGVQELIILSVIAVVLIGGMTAVIIVVMNSNKQRDD